MLALVVDRVELQIPRLARDDKGSVGFPFGIGYGDPWSQKRDLGTLRFFTDAAN